MQIVVFHDIVAVALDAIHDELDVPTGTRVPAERPNTFVLARRVGGERRNPVVEAVRVMFECWSTTPADADDLAADVRQVLFGYGAPGAWASKDLNGVTVYSIEDVGGPADQPDELSDQPRATFTLQFVMRGTIQEETNG